MSSFKLSVFITFAIVAQVLSFPVEEPEIPILTPMDSVEPIVEPVTESSPSEAADHTDFPILRPNDDDFQIDRPAPVDNVENGNEAEGKPVDRPTPEEDGFLPNIPGLFPVESFALENMGMRAKRSAGGADDGDDTVVVEAASCAELKQECEDEGDLITCQIYNEQCTDEKVDEQEISDVLDCINSGKVECPRLSAQ